MMKQPRSITAIIDLQFGSTGKGLIAGYLAERNQPDTIVTAWAANAGHTYINARGRVFVHTMVANGIVSPKLERLMMGPGSVIDPDNLLKEIESCIDVIGNADIFVHANAAIITQAHRDEEAGPMTKIGSTKKGCGAAAIHRIRRNPEDSNVASTGLLGHPVLKHLRVLSPVDYNRELDKARVIQIEGAQGYSLSMYHGFYPYCTSRDVSTAQTLADCGIPIDDRWGKLRVVGTARTYPIRVANRFDEDGKQVGWSGPSYDDQDETSFEALEQKIELTTVTKLPRRIFTFSQDQVKQAIRQCGVQEIFLNFANYCKTGAELGNIVRTIEEAGAVVRYLGFGAAVGDVYDMNQATDEVPGGVLASKMFDKVM